MNNDLRFLPRSFIIGVHIHSNIKANEAKCELVDLLCCVLVRQTQQNGYSVLLVMIFDLIISILFITYRIGTI